MVDGVAPDGRADTHAPSMARGAIYIDALSCLVRLFARVHGLYPQALGGH